MFAQLLRFVGVGGLATLSHVLAAIVAQAALPVTAQQANLAGFCAGVLVSYTGHSRLTFGAPFRSGPQFLRFLALSLAGLAISSLTVHVATEVLGLSFLAAMVAVAVMVPAFTYLAMRYWVFAGKAGDGLLSPLDLAVPALMAALLLAILWDRIPHHDVAWHLFATRDWLAGARLYVDVVEVNPPLDVYLTVPALLLADSLGLGDANGHHSLLALILFLTLVWSAAILRKGPVPTLGRRALMLAGTALAILLPALNSLGQREHLMVMAMLPWALIEASGRNFPRSQRVMSAAVAAVGMCLKPHFVLFPLAVTIGNCLVARSLRPILSLPNGVFLLVGAAYVGLVWLAHPEYLTDVVPAALLVDDADGKPWTDILLGVVFVGLPFALLIVALRRHEGVPREVQVFLTLALGGLASYLLQGGGFNYHAIPFAAFASLACLFVLLRGTARPVSMLLAGLTLALSATDGLKQGPYANDLAAAARVAVAGQGDIDSVAALSSHASFGPPVAIALGADWASSYPAQWLVPGAVDRLAQTDCGASPDLCDRLRGIAARNRTGIISDIARLLPRLLIVDQQPGEFDWLAFMDEDPAWAPVFAAYRQIGSDGQARYFLREP